jgi:hypothetical protein
MIERSKNVKKEQAAVLTHACGTSPIAATPAGSDKTPAPTQPLIKLKAAAAIVCSRELESPALAAIVGDVEAFRRILTPVRVPPPLHRDGIFLSSEWREHIFAMTGRASIENALDRIVIVSMDMERTISTALVTLIALSLILFNPKPPTKEPKVRG